MPRHHLINGVKVDFTEAEETAWDNAAIVYANGAFNRAIARLREDRNRKLSATDFYALSDVTMSEEMTTYRQNLRDLPDGLTTVEDVDTVTWPTKP